MAQYELENLFITSMESFKKLVIDTETVVGKPIELSNGTVIIPLSRLSVGYGMGGWDYDNSKETSNQKNTNTKKEGITAGTGGGATVKPAGFIVVSSDGNVKILNIDSATPLEKICDMIPATLQSLADLFGKGE